MFSVEMQPYCVMHGLFIGIHSEERTDIMKKLLLLLCTACLILASCSYEEGSLADADIGNNGKAAKLLTSENIYLMSFSCGYVSDTRSFRLIIETEQQLDCAMEEYGSMFADLFSETAEEYPLRDYSYVVEYVEVGSGGYALKAGALAVDTDRLYFVQSEDSRTPDPLSDQPAVMDGFCYMAVLPKGTLMNEHYEGWTYP